MLFCGTVDESLEHLFVIYSNITTFWSDFIRWCRSIIIKIREHSALEQQTIPDAETLSFTIYQIEPVGRLMNQINRSLKQTNETTEMIIETRTTYNAEKCSNSCDDT